MKNKTQLPLDKNGQFRNFMCAEGTAEKLAQLFVNEGQPCLGIQLIQERVNGNGFTEKQHLEVLYIYHRAIKDSRRDILTSFVTLGYVKECNLSRRFMACLPIYR